MPLSISGSAKEDKPFFFPKKTEDGKTIESVQYDDDEEDDDDEEYDDDDEEEDDDDDDEDNQDGHNGGIFLQLATKDKSSIDDLSFFNNHSSFFLLYYQYSFGLSNKLQSKFKKVFLLFLTIFMRILIYLSS